MLEVVLWLWHVYMVATRAGSLCWWWVCWQKQLVEQWSVHKHCSDPTECLKKSLDDLSPCRWKMSRNISPKQPGSFLRSISDLLGWTSQRPNAYTDHLKLELTYIHLIWISSFQIQWAGLQIQNIIIVSLSKYLWPALHIFTHLKLTYCISWHGCPQITASSLLINLIFIVFKSIVLQYKAKTSKIVTVPIFYHLKCTLYLLNISKL